MNFLWNEDLYRFIPWEWDRILDYKNLTSLMGYDGSKSQ